MKITLFEGPAFFAGFRIQDSVPRTKGIFLQFYKINIADNSKNLLFCFSTYGVNRPLCRPGSGPNFTGSRSKSRTSMEHLTPKVCKQKCRLLVAERPGLMIIAPYPFFYEYGFFFFSHNASRIRCTCMLV